MKRNSFVQRYPILTTLSLSSIVQLNCVATKPREIVELYNYSDAMNKLHDYVYDKCYTGCLIASVDNYSFECDLLCSKSMCTFDYMLEED